MNTFVRFLIVTFAVFLFSSMAVAIAQKSPLPTAPAPFNIQTVALTPAEKTAVDLAQTKIENLQLRFAQMQTDYQHATQQMQVEFKTQSDALNKALDDARRAHGLGSDAVFNGTVQDPRNPTRQPFTFTVPAKPAAKTK